VTVKTILRRPVKRTCCHPAPYPVLIKRCLLRRIPNWRPYSGLRVPPHCPRPTVTPKNKITDLKQLGEKRLPWHPRFQEHLFSAPPTKFPSSPMSLSFGLLTSFTQGWSRGCWPRVYLHSTFRACSRPGCCLLGWTWLICKEYLGQSWASPFILYLLLVTLS
jgi:hypothetical protein